MKAKKLRLGNIVRSKINGISIVEQIGSSINPEYVGGRSLEGNYWENSYSPIEIDEGWLRKFGFKDFSHGVEKRFTKDNFNWYSSLAEVVVELDNGVQGYDLYTDCKHVHELQNLFFAITGEELELKFELEKFEGDVFTFAEEFTSTVIDGIVYLEEYGEGAFPLPHIKTEEQYLMLYKILTGKSTPLK